MKWYAELKEEHNVEGIQHNTLYSYKTTRDYDQQFYVFNGKRWVDTESEKFKISYLVD